MASFSKGTSFTDGVTGDVTAAKLHALVDAATPVPGFITDRTAETSIATDDLVLISDTSDSGALNKMTVANFTNIVSTGTGTAADPAIRPTGDTNTGIFFPAADTAAISTAGSERVRVDSSGNVGIGGSPSLDWSGDARALRINGSGTQACGVRASNANGSAELVISGTTSLWGLYSPSNLPFALYTNATERLRITSGGEVYIAGTTDQGAYNLQVNGTGVWGAGAYVNGSDERLKENIQDITSGLDVVEKLRPVSFQYKEDYTADRSVQSGFIAQDLLVALEGKNYLEGVVSQGPTYYNVAYQNLIPILAKAIQELKAENDSLKTRIAALEAA